MEGDKKKALAVAANVLRYKNRSSEALYERLLEKGIDSEDAEYAVNRLRELGFLNDYEYGESVVRQCRAKGWGAIRVKQELKKRKVPAEYISSLLEGFSPDYEKALKTVRGVLDKSGTADNRAALKKASDSLARKGYSWEQIYKVLEEYRYLLEENSGE